MKEYVRTILDYPVKGIQFRDITTLLQNADHFTQVIDEMWANINEKHDYNEWHVHPYSNLSGAYYVKHDGSKKNGDILFKHPDPFYAKGYGMLHWPPQSVEAYNEVSAPIVEVTPKTNLLLLFPSWLEHEVNNNLKNDTRISFSFNTTLLKIN